MTVEEALEEMPNLESVILETHEPRIDPLYEKCVSQQINQFSLNIFFFGDNLYVQSNSLLPTTPVNLNSRHNKHCPLNPWDFMTWKLHL